MSTRGFLFLCRESTGTTSFLCRESWGSLAPVQGIQEGHLFLCKGLLGSRRFLCRESPGTTSSCAGESLGATTSCAGESQRAASSSGAWGHLFCAGSCQMEMVLSSLGHRASTTGVCSGLGANSYTEISVLLVFMIILLTKHFSKCVQAHFQLASGKRDWMIKARFFPACLALINQASKSSL